MNIRKFKDILNDDKHNLRIVTIAPLPGSTAQLITKTVRQIKKSRAAVPLTKTGLWAYITSAYKMSKKEETELLETLSIMGYK